MKQQYADVLQQKMDEESFAKLSDLSNDKLHAFVVDAVGLCKPDSVRVFSDAPEDIAAVRQMALDNGEEQSLEMEGHTVHFDGYYDQARAKDVTKYLLPADMDLGERINSTDREEGLAEVRGFLDGAMVGKVMLVRFFCLGPVKSPFSLPCAQITDSAYVAHSEDLLYRPGYETFRDIGDSPDFFRFLHSAGKLENHVSVEVTKKRVYMDIVEELVYSTNTQYAGNTVGLKKLALRLALRKAHREGWLAEHMFVMGVHGPEGRVTYFTGAFPSACGKTSTAMIPGETIIGDDLAYFRVIDNEMRAVNVESGIFGIIRDVNPDDDPVIYEVLTTPGEVIFSNVLVADGKPDWLGMGGEIPEEGVNHSGPWHKGKTDEKGNTITPSHKNARYTVRISALANRDPHADDPHGVPVGAWVFGGRDSDTCVPVVQAFDWRHGIITIGASLESESTAATIGAEGVRTFNIMSNLDFLSMPLGEYIANDVAFGEGLDKTPGIFGVNYFLRDEAGGYLNGMRDKAVWIKWAELRVHGDVEAIESPVGFLPKCDDLRKLFTDVLGKGYSQEDYVRQFTIRIPELLAKIERIEKIYRSEEDVPAMVFETLEAQRQRLTKLQGEKGDHVSPLDL